MGEFNINKTTGELNPTAGMPETYPAEQVMMSDGTTSVEEALDGIKVLVCKDVTFTFSNNASSIQKTISSISGGVVVSSNLIGLVVTASGMYIGSGLSGDRTKVGIRDVTGTPFTGDITANVIFFYE